MLKIGITGGIGSGKTTVCKIFESLGIPVYYADTEAKKLMTEDAGLKKQITAIFGWESYLPDGQLNRLHIGKQAFNNTDLLNKLNAAVHPAVTAHFLSWAETYQNLKPYVVKEAALIFEAETYKDLDYVITVSAPIGQRTKRVMERDGVSEQEVKNRMQKQWSERKRNKAADFQIKNDGQHALIPQVLALHKVFLEAGGEEVRSEEVRW